MSLLYKGQKMKHKLILKKAQRGLSLLMTMVVLAIIGVLAEVALSAYQNYAAQPQAAETDMSKKH